MSDAGRAYFVAGIRSDAVSNATGREWQEWFRILDQAGAESLPEPDITRYLHDTQGLSSLWSRMVTLGYEQARGRRAPRWSGESQAISVSRRYPVPRARLYRAWADDHLRARWLYGQPVSIRKAVPDESMRITWTDRISGLNVRFEATGPASSLLTVQHIRLPDAEQAHTLEEYWTNALERLAQLLGVGLSQRKPDD